MNIWLINHYAVPPQYYPLIRQYNFGKYLLRMGHKVTIFAASTVHNSNTNLITDGSLYKILDVDGIKYVVVNCKGYAGNGLKRVLNMFEFSRKLPKVCKKFEKPDAIVSTSMPPMSCAKGIKIAKEYGCKAIAEIADLWPESIVAYGIAGPHNPAVIALRRLEKWIYKKSDAIVFTMENAYAYIEEQGWAKEIPRSKVHYINNGIDLESFEYNRLHYIVHDEDLDNPSIFKVVYTGSIRKVNNVGLLVDAVKLVKNKKVRLLVWGAGDELEALKERLRKENIKNVVFKGFVDKRYIPSIITRSDLNVVHRFDDKIAKYGISSNKHMEYFAAGRPILVSKMKHCPMQNSCCNIFYEPYPEGIAEAIDKVADMDTAEYSLACNEAKNAAQEYDFKRLTSKLIDVIESV